MLEYRVAINVRNLASNKRVRYRETSVGINRYHMYPAPIGTFAGYLVEGRFGHCACTKHQRSYETNCKSAWVEHFVIRPKLRE